MIVKSLLNLVLLISIHVLHDLKDRAKSIDTRHQRDNVSETNNSDRLEYPLRVPDALMAHFESYMSSSHRNPRQADFSPTTRLPPLRPGVYSCGHEGSEMFINFINPSYPEKNSNTGSCIFKLKARSQNVCQVRVDFVDTEFLSPNEGNCDDQFLQIGGATWPNGIKKVCGINSDQHFYVHLDRSNRNGGDEIDFIVTTVTGKSYKFGLWITQINCDSGSDLEAPGDCTQLFLGQEGFIKTFNFEGSQYLANLNYRACIRSERDACFMMYQADPNQFHFQLFIDRGNRRFVRRNRSVQNPSGRGDEDCGLDYIRIPAGRANASSTGQSFDRFCGGFLNTESNEGVGIAIYSEIIAAFSWIQIVTTPRDENLKTMLSNLSRRRTSLSVFPFFSSNNNFASTRINEGFAEPGTGMRLRFSQINKCLSTSFF